MDPAGDVQRRPSPVGVGYAGNLEMAKTLISTSLLKIVSNRRAENAKRRGKRTCVVRRDALLEQVEMGLEHDSRLHDMEIVAALKHRFPTGRCG